VVTVILIERNQECGRMAQAVAARSPVNGAVGMNFAIAYPAVNGLGYYPPAAEKPGEPG
jgi:hypothetical protein